MANPKKSIGKQQELPEIPEISQGEIDRHLIVKGLNSLKASLLRSMARQPPGRIKDAYTAELASLDDLLKHYERSNP